MKDCTNIKLYLHCNDIPNFDNSCVNILLAPYNLAYPGLQRQVEEQKLNVITNLWNQGVQKQCMLPSEFQQVRFITGILGQGEAVNPFPLPLLYFSESEGKDHIELTQIKHPKADKNESLRMKRPHEGGDNEPIQIKKEKH